MSLAAQFEGGFDEAVGRPAFGEAVGGAGVEAEDGGPGVGEVEAGFEGSEFVVGDGEFGGDGIGVGAKGCGEMEVMMDVMGFHLRPGFGGRVYPC